jgi:hypothetical protein
LQKEETALAVRHEMRRLTAVNNPPGKERLTRARVAVNIEQEPAALVIN